RRLAANPQEVRCVALSPDGGKVLAATGASVRVWDLATGQEAGRFTGHTDAVRSVVFLAGGGRAASAGDDRVVRVWDVHTGREVHGGRELRRFQGHRQMITAAAFTPGGAVLSGSQDQAVCLWDVDSGCLFCRGEGHGGGVTCLAASPDGRHAVSGGMDATLCL